MNKSIEHLSLKKLSANSRENQLYFFLMLSFIHRPDYLMSPLHNLATLTFFSRRTFVFSCSSIMLISSVVSFFYLSPHLYSTSRRPQNVHLFLLHAHRTPYHFNLFTQAGHTFSSLKSSFSLFFFKTLFFHPFYT